MFFPSMKNLIVICALIAFPSLAGAQAVIDTAMHGKEVGGVRFMRLKPTPGDRFRYRVTIKSQISVKNSDDLLGIPELRPNDKAAYVITYYFTTSLRRIRQDGASDFQIHIDSLRSTLESNGSRTNYNSNISADSDTSEESGIYAGGDFGAIVDKLGNLKEVYGFYDITDKLVGALNDSLQTDDTID